MKAYIVSSSDVKFEISIAMEETPLEIVKRFIEEDPDNAQYVCANAKAGEQFMRDGQLDERVSTFDLMDVTGRVIHTEWDTELGQQPDVKEGISELEAEDMPIRFVCSVVAIVAAG